MVNLTMRVGETLVIGQKLAVTVLSIEGDQVRIDIAAEADTAIHRQAALRARRRNNGDQTAAAARPPAKPTKVP